MHSKFIKELEEKSCIKGFIEYRCQQDHNAELIEYPIISVTQKQLGQKNNIPDAIIQIGDELYFCEVATISRNKDMRKRIGEIRKRLYVPNHQLHGPYNLGILLDGAKGDCSRMLDQKFNKDYSEFMKLKQIEKGVLLIEGIFEDVFFNHEQAVDLIDWLSDKVILDQLGAGRSCFTEAYFCSYVQEPDGTWPMKYFCIADSAMFKLLKKRNAVMMELRKEHASSRM